MNPGRDNNSDLLKPNKDYHKSAAREHSSAAEGSFSLGLSALRKYSGCYVKSGGEQSLSTQQVLSSDTPM